LIGTEKKIFDVPSLDDMPTGYRDLRTLLQLEAINISEKRLIIQNKLLLYSGIQNSSIENINSSNERRIEIYEEFVKYGLPYIETEEEKKHEQILRTIQTHKKDIAF
jgi:hypothetical protein